MVPAAMVSPRKLLIAGVVATLALGGCNGGDDTGKGSSTTTAPRAEGPTTTTVPKPDPATPLGMFCESFERYLSDAAQAAPSGKAELERRIEGGRAVLTEVLERSLPEIASDVKVLRDATFAYWDALAAVGYDIARVTDEAKLAYLRDTATARSNLERFGTGTCGIVTTTTSKKKDG